MTLGSGAYHSERNGSKSEPMRFLQFWILPDTLSLPPSVQQRQFTLEDRRNRLLRVMGSEGGHVVKVHQDASAFVASLDPGVGAEHRFSKSRAGYLYLIRGAGEFTDADELETGDAVKVFGLEEVRIQALERTELILIDVPRQYEPTGVWAR